MIQTTRDNLELRFRDVWESAADSRYEPAWYWIGLAIAFLLALLPTDFKDFLSIPGFAWETIVMGGLSFSIIMAVKTMYTTWWHNKTARYSSPQAAIAALLDDVHESPPNQPPGTS